MDILELIDDREQSNLVNSARPFSCPWPNCVKSFNRKSDLQRHHRIHTNERPYSCSHTGCGKSFIQRSALTVHIRTHTGEKPHHCEYIGCGKCFSDSSSLARHRRIHTGKRPYKCVIDKCDKSFCRKTTLTKHARRTHCIRNENDPSDDDGSDSDSDPQAVDQPLQRSGWARSRHSMPRAFVQNGPPMNRTQSLQNFKSEALPPQSPQPSRSLSNRTSFSADAFGYVTAPMMQAQNSAQSFASNNPPTPQSPIYLTEHSHDDVISPMGATPRALGGDFQSIQRGPHHSVSQAEIDAMKVVCSSPVKHQQLVAPNLQNSPSSLSSCSSTTSNSCQSQEYYYRNAQHVPIPNYQLQTTQLDPNSMVQYQHIPVSMPTGGANQIHAAPTPEQNMWYDTMAYQQPVMVTPVQPVGQPRLFPNFVNGYPMPPEWLVKTEQDPSMMLPSPRSALF